MTKKRIIKFFIWTSIGFIVLLIFFSVGLYFFKDNIIASLLQEVNKHLKTTIKVEKVDIAFWSTFPNLSVNFHQVFIRDTYENATEKDTMFYSEKIRFRFNPIDIYRQNYRLKRIDILPGTFQFKINEQGQTNVDIFQPSPDTTRTQFNIDLQKITLQHLRFSVTDTQNQYQYQSQLIATTLEGDFTEQIFTLHANSQLIIHQLKKGQINFISKKQVDLELNLQIDHNKQTIQIPKSTIKIAQLPFEINGFISPTTTKIAVNAQQIELTELVNNFTLEELNTITHYQGQGTANFALLIEHKDEKTQVDCRFGVKNGKLNEPNIGLHIANIQLQGHYTNLNKKDVLVIQNLQFTTETGPFNGNITISEFDAPILKGSLYGNVDLFAVHQLFHLPKIDRIDGQLDINTDFELQFFNAQHIDLKHCRGSIQFDNNSLQLTNDNRQINKLNGRIQLQDDKIELQEISANIATSDIKIDGKILNIAHFWNKNTQNRNKPHFYGAIHSEKIQLEDFLSTSSNMEIDSVKKQAQNEFIVVQTPDFFTTANVDIALNVQELTHGQLSTRQIKALFKIENGKVQVDQLSIGTFRFAETIANQTHGTILVSENTISIKELSIAEIRHQKHRFQNIKGNVFIENNQLQVQSLAFTSLQSNVQGNLQVQQVNDRFIASGTLLTKNLLIKDLFEEWDDFSQDLIKSSNIEGYLDAEINFTIPIDRQNGVISNKIQANANLKLQNGRLKNVEIFREIIQNINTPATKLIIGAANIAYFNQQLADITFKTLENNIQIDRGTILIPQMDIHSSAMNITVSGQHTFDNNIDYQFAFRLRDLKESKSSQFGDIIDDNSGLKVYLKMYGTVENPKFAWNKEAQKNVQKQYNQKEKQTFKEMMKSDFNLFKNDTNVQKYSEPKKNKEIIQIEDKNDFQLTEPQKNEEKKGKINKLLKKMENEESKRKQVEVEFE